jgi:hypothetical protein
MTVRGLEYPTKRVSAHASMSRSPKLWLPPRSHCLSEKKPFESFIGDESIRITSALPHRFLESCGATRFTLQRKRIQGFFRIPPGRLMGSSSIDSVRLAA